MRPTLTNQHDTANAPTGLGLSGLETLQHFAAGAALPFDLADARRAWLESNGDEAEPAQRQSVQQLQRAGRQIGLRVESRLLSVREALVATAFGPLATCVLSGESDTWLVLGPASRRKVAVVSRSGSREIGKKDLLRLLGVSSVNDTATWVCAQTTLPCSAPVDPAAGTHHASHGASHGHHPSPLVRLYRLLRPEASDIGIAVVFAFVVGLLGLATPVAVEALVNTVAFGRFLQPVIVLCVLLFGFLGFAAVLRLLQTFIAEVIQRRIFARVVADLAFRLPRVRTEALDGHHGPELLNRFFDVMTVQKSAALLVLDGIAIVIQSLIGMAVLAVYHPFLAGFDLFLLASLAFVVFVLGRGAVRTAIQESKAKYSVAACLEELAEFGVTAKAQGGPRRATELADRLTHAYLNARHSHFRIVLRQVAFSLGLQAVSGSILLGLGGWLVISGQLTLGQLVAAELIVAVIVGAFAKLGKQMESLYDLLAAVDKLGHLFDLPIERTRGERLPTKPEGAGLVFRDVTFSFGEHPVLSGFEMHVKPGELVVLTGPAGTGKSLLLDLAYGLREPTSGCVTIDSVDLRGIEPESLREQVALVRSIETFTGTLGENVHLNRDTVTQRGVREALATVGLLDEVQTLPNGLDAELQPGGGLLSDSQARRLMLARAIAGRPRLLLIDGVLDALPDELLPRVMKALQWLSGPCTIVIATGRGDVAGYCNRSVRLGPEPTSPDDGEREDSPEVFAFAG